LRALVVAVPTSALSTFVFWVARDVVTLARAVAGARRAAALTAVFLIVDSPKRLKRVEIKEGF